VRHLSTVHKAKVSNTNINIFISKEEVSKTTSMLTVQKAEISCHKVVVGKTNNSSKGKDQQDKHNKYQQFIR